MTAAPSIANDAAILACDAIVDALDVALNGYMIIYSGTMPARVDAALSGNTALVTIDLSATAFGGAVDVPGSNLARATLAGVPLTGTAVADGTGTFFRAFDGNGRPLIQGNVGTSASDAIIDNPNIATGQDVTLESWVFNVPES